MLSKLCRVRCLQVSPELRLPLGLLEWALTCLVSCWADVLLAGSVRMGLATWLLSFLAVVCLPLMKVWRQGPVPELHARARGTSAATATSASACDRKGTCQDLSVVSAAAAQAQYGLAPTAPEPTDTAPASSTPPGSSPSTGPPPASGINTSRSQRHSGWGLPTMPSSAAGASTSSPGTLLPAGATSSSSPARQQGSKSAAPLSLEHLLQRTVVAQQAAQGHSGSAGMPRYKGMCQYKVLSIKVRVRSRSVAAWLQLLQRAVLVRLSSS